MNKNISKEGKIMSTVKKEIWKRTLTIIILIVIFLSIGISGYLISVKKYQTDVKNMTFTPIDISKIKDGTYIGDCDVNFIYAKVQVTVKDGKLEHIELLEHKHERGAAAERIVTDMEKEQRVDVDVVSGATNSSVVIKKAVENALSGTALVPDTK